jgi:hypothetical protein
VIIDINSKIVTQVSPRFPFFWLSNIPIVSLFLSFSVSKFLAFSQISHSHLFVKKILKSKRTKRSVTRRARAREERPHGASKEEANSRRGGEQEEEEGERGG